MLLCFFFNCKWWFCWSGFWFGIVLVLYCAWFGVVSWFFFFFSLRLWVEVRLWCCRLDLLLVEFEVMVLLFLIFYFFFFFGFIDIDVLQFLGKFCFNIKLDPNFCYVFIFFTNGKWPRWVMSANGFNYKWVKWHLSNHK